MGGGRRTDAANGSHSKPFCSPAIHIRRRALGSPKRRPQLTLNDAWFCPWCASQRWQQVFGERAAATKSDYKKWAGVLAVVEGGVDESDGSVKLRNFFE